MSVGGVRRVQVRPDYGLGWKKPGKCAEEIGAVALFIVGQHFCIKGTLNSLSNGSLGFRV